jgi:hypothetical protein
MCSFIFKQIFSISQVLYVSCAPFFFGSHFTCIYCDVYPRLSVSTTYAPHYLLVSLYVFLGTCKFAHQLLLEQHKNLVKDQWPEPS